MEYKLMTSVKMKTILVDAINTDAVKSARSLGINSHHYDKDAKDLAALKSIIDENL